MKVMKKRKETRERGVSLSSISFPPPTAIPNKEEVAETDDHRRGSSSCFRLCRIICQRRCLGTRPKCTARSGLARVSALLSSHLHTVANKPGSAYTNSSSVNNKRESYEVSFVRERNRKKLSQNSFR